MKSLLMTILACAAFSLTLRAQGVDVPTAMAVSPDLNVIITGTSMNSAGLMEYLVTGYGASGTAQATIRTLPGSGGPSIPSAMAMDGDMILVTGSSPAAGTGYDIVTILVRKSSIVSVETPGRTPTMFSLSQSYPNPVSSSDAATIRYSLPEAGHVRLSVVDHSGREVALLADETKNAGMYEALFQPRELPAGSYFYVLESSKRSEVRKLAVIR